QPSPRGREPKLLAASRCPFPRLRGTAGMGVAWSALRRPCPAAPMPPPQPPPARGGGSQRSRAALLPLPPLAGGPGWGRPGPRRGIPVPVLRCPHPPLPRTRGREPKKPRRALLPLPTLAGEGAKAVAPQAPRLLPPLAGEGRDGGHLALAVASPFPCSDAPPQPSPARGEGAGGWRVDGGRARVSGHASGYATWISAIEAGAVPGRRRARPVPPGKVVACETVHQGAWNADVSAWRGDRCAARGGEAVRRGRDRAARGADRRGERVPAGPVAQARRTGPARHDRARRVRRQRHGLPRPPGGDGGDLPRVRLGRPELRRALQPLRVEPVRQRQPGPAREVPAKAVQR